MQFGAVAFMLTERILRELRAKVTHHSVACNLCDHAGGSYAQANAIPIDDCGLRTWKRDNRQPVDQNMVGRDSQPFNRHSHGPMRGAQDIDSINLHMIDNADGPGDFDVAGKIDINLLAQFRRELFRIV